MCVCNAICSTLQSRFGHVTSLSGTYLIKEAIIAVAEDFDLRLLALLVPLPFG